MGIKKKGNNKKSNFLSKVPVLTLRETDIETRMKFNFSFLHTGANAGQSFVDWNKKAGQSKLVKLNYKLIEYCKSPMNYWENQASKSGHVLKFYPRFPSHSKFAHPKHVPTDVEWGVFRLEAACRLAGFRISKEINRQYDNLYDENTFYVVFLDENHDFYPTEKKNT